MFRFRTVEVAPRKKKNMCPALDGEGGTRQISFMHLEASLLPCKSATGMSGSCALTHCMYLLSIYIVISLFPRLLQCNLR